MQKAEGRRQKTAFSRPPWWAHAVAAVVFVLSQPYQLLADGGTLRVSRRIQHRQVSVFTSPSVLRTGLVDISVLVQMAETGSVCQDEVIRVELTSLEQPSTVLTEKATAGAATNKLFKSAIFNVPYAGQWHARILLDSEESPTEPAVEFEVSIAPPLPPWLVLTPWIGWPFGVIALFGIHQWLVSRKQRRPHSPPTLPLNKQLQIELGHVS